MWVAMAKYLVTGGAGFIGSHLCKALAAAGHQLAVLDDLSSGQARYLPIGVPLYIGNVADPKEVAQAMLHVDGVFHLAAVASVPQSLEHWFAVHRTNLSGTVAVLEAAAAARVPVVYASSAAVYGEPNTLPITEASAESVLSPYAADKRGSELHAAVLRGVFGVPAMGLRFFNVYGPRQDPRSPYSGVISRFAQQITTGKPITLFGDGQQTRDFIYVGDVVRGLMAAMQALTERGLDTPPVCNLCTGRETRVIDLARRMMEIWKQQVPIEHVEERAGEIRRSVGDATRMRDILKIESYHALEQGLEQLRISLQQTR